MCSIARIGAIKIDAYKINFPHPDAAASLLDTVTIAKGNGGGIFVYIKDSIPHRILKTHSGITNAIEYMSFEVCFKRRKWFLVYMYKPPKVSDESAWSVLSQLAVDFVDSSKLAIFFGDINHDMFKDNILHDLCDVYDLKNVIRGPTCFKGENPTLLDVFLTNKPSSFCNCIKYWHRDKWFPQPNGCHLKNPCSSIQQAPDHI